MSEYQQFRPGPGVSTSSLVQGPVIQSLIHISIVFSQIPEFSLDNSMFDYLEEDSFSPIEISIIEDYINSENYNEENYDVTYIIESVDWITTSIDNDNLIISLQSILNQNTEGFLDSIKVTVSPVSPSGSGSPEI